MTSISVKPAEGRRVRGPSGEILHEAGGVTSDSSFWRRREAAGDVIISAVPAKRGKGEDK